MTIYDIAKIAGVSGSTVSRVLNNKPGVSSEMRKKVMKLLEEYHFEPNASAQGLVSQSSKIIGIMMSDIRTVHHSESAYYVEQALQQAGYSCLIVNCGFTDESRENGLRLLASRRAEAVLLIGSTFQSEKIKLSIQRYLSDLPVIIENGFIDLPNVYSVLADEEKGVAECMHLLFSKGRRNICYVNINRTPSNELKIKGFVHAWNECMPGREPMILDLKHHPDQEEWAICYEGTRDLIERHPEIDSLIFSTDLLANAGMRALQDAGIRIPEQVSVIGIDNSIYSQLSYPRMTVLDNKMPELSIMCSNILLQILNGKDVSHQLMVVSEIIEREST